MFRVHLGPALTYRTMSGSSLYPTVLKRDSKYFRLKEWLQTKSDEICCIGWLLFHSCGEALRQSNLRRKKSLYWLTAQGSHWPGYKAAGDKHGSQGGELRAHPLPQAQSRQSELETPRVGFNPKGPVLGDILPPARPCRLNLPKQFHPLGSSIQMRQAMRGIPHSNHPTCRWFSPTPLTLPAASGAESIACPLLHFIWGRLRMQPTSNRLRALMISPGPSRSGVLLLVIGKEGKPARQIWNHTRIGRVLSSRPVLSGVIPTTWYESVQIKWTTT